MKNPRARRLKTSVMGIKDVLTDAYFALYREEYGKAAQLLEATRSRCAVLIAEIENETAQPRQAAAQ